MSSSETAADQQHRPASAAVRPSCLAPRPSEPEHLPCPRCDSVNTKFCYYNNYNLSQPRHFCKSCRRYWTRGGSLRNVPVGGGTRKSSSGGASHKRPRVDPALTSPAENEHEHANQNHNPNPDPGQNQDQQHVMSVPMVTSFAGCDVSLNLNEAVPTEVAPNFGSYLQGNVNVNLNVNMNGGGMLPFGSGFGLGLGSGPYGLGFGLGPLDWPMDPIGGHNDVSQGGGVEENGGVGDVSGGDGNGSGSGGSSSNTWQMGSGVDGSLNDGDCFGWPDLAMSVPGKGLK